MYFKKLELIGFKSFAEKTLLRFEPGITAVVGPNGCGKSNIFDAIRWVLGEQSIKSLRGAKMEDVIFNGTEKILALGFAEASLTLSNEAKILPIDYEEITITRRLYRSGESEYLLNNNPVRLKDINELFMGTGIGAESYSLVEQGKIDLVLSSRPEDRRLVFDEATGVSKYKAKKKEALRKLEETENNLLRVNDIILEVKRQISSIERQASKARRYKEIYEKLKELEVKLSLNEINTLKMQSKELEIIESNIKEKIAQFGSSLNELSKKISLQQNEIQALNQEIINLNNDLLNYQNLIERKNQHIRNNEERILEFNSRLEGIDTQKNNLSSHIKRDEENLSKINQEIEKIKKELLEKQGLLEEKEAKFKEAEKAISQAQERIKQANAKTFQIVSNKTKFNNELIDISSSLNNLNARKRRLETELIKTRQEKNSHKSELESNTKQVEEIRLNFQALRSKLDSSKKVFADKQNEIKNFADQINKLNNTKISLQSQKEFLQELKLKYEDMPSAKEAELTIKNMEEIDPKEITGIIARAKSVTFDKASKTYRISCEAKLFSLDIHLIDEKISQIELQIQEKTKILNSLENQSKLLKNEVETFELNLQKEQISLADKDAVLKSFQANFERICEELSLLEFEQTDVNENIDSLTKREAEAKKHLDELSQENVNLENTLSTSQSEISASSKLRESFLLEITRLKAELTSIKTKENDITMTLSMLQRSLSAEQESLKAHEQEKLNCITKTKELERESFKLKKEIGDLKNKVEETQAELKLKNQSLEQKEKVQGELKEEEQAENYEIDEDKESLHKQQLSIQENTFKLNQIKERMLQLYQFNMDHAAHPPELMNMDTTLIKEEIEILRKKIDGFGTVNLVAIEELEELRKRHDFLDHQQKDLNTAKEALNEAIKKINRTTRKMFLDTFQLVAKEFKNYFRLLFGGGDAELFLVDEENVLESGIEIVCRPPGKKLQNILLLSGGEKSLSAIALIFAIFKTKPAPFCVLDEIDAALDESNVDRFSRMLEEFAKLSQFIVITHNKKTIAHANVMYGITMEESGISKIVSVKLSENQNKDTSKENKSALLAAEKNNFLLKKL